MEKIRSIFGAQCFFSIFSTFGMNIYEKSSIKTVNEYHLNYNQQCIPQNTIIKNLDSKSCRNIVWVQTSLYNEKFCENLYNCLTHCIKHNMTDTNSFKFLNIINNLKNDIISKSINTNESEYIYTDLSNFIHLDYDTQAFYNKIIYLHYLLYLKELYKEDQSKATEKFREIISKKIDLCSYQYFITIDNKDKNSIYNDSYRVFKNSNNDRNLIVNKYINEEYVKNLSEDSKKIINTNLAHFIYENKIVLPSIINGNIIYNEHPYDSFVIWIIINLALYSIKEDYAFKTFYKGIGLFKNDNLIISEYPIIFNNNYKLKYTHNFFHETAKAHYSFMDTNGLIIENYSKTNKYIKNYSFNMTKTVTGAYIYEKINNNNSPDRFYNTYELFKVIYSVDNFIENMETYLEYYIFENLRNYTTQDPDKRNDSINKINSMINSTSNIITKTKELFNIKTYIEIIKQKFNLYKITDEEKFHILNSFFFHKYFDKDIQKSNISYIQKLLQLLNFTKK